MVALLVSLAALILASAGMAWHVWRHHNKRNQTPVRDESPAAVVPEETEVETEEAP